MHQIKPLYQKKNYAIIAVTAVTASAMLFGGMVSATGQSSQHHSTGSAVHANKESQAAIDLRAGLTTLLTDHVTTNLEVNRLIASGAAQADIDIAISAQVANAEALSGAVGSIYGPEAAAHFSELFLEHIEESNSFAMAVAAGDEAAKQLANEELQEYLVDIAHFFSNAIPVLSFEAVYGLLLEHENLINQSTEALINQNFGQSKKYEQQAIRQVKVIADALASGIIETQPDKF